MKTTSTLSFDGPAFSVALSPYGEICKFIGHCLEASSDFIGLHFVHAGGVAAIIETGEPLLYSSPEYHSLMCRLCLSFNCTSDTELDFTAVAPHCKSANFSSSQ